MKKTPHEIIAEPVIEALQDAMQSPGAWTPPWRSAMASGRPLRENGEPYTGINPFLLMLSAAAQGFTSPYWMTFKGAKRHGGKVRKGSKSTAICFYKTYTKKVTDAAGEETEEGRRVLRYYRVFNADQIDGLPEKYHPAASADESPADVNLDALRVIEDAGVTVTLGGSRAFYNPSLDSIQLPAADDFTSTAGFNGTALHELTHATGHESRLARKFGKRFGDHAYAAEELVAEFGATILCATFGFEYELEHHASYLAHWHKALKNNPSILAASGAAAQKAAQWVLDTVNEADSREAA